MEEPLKARLIGAAVLVALAVLLIPELLSGRKAVEPVVDDAVPRGTRTFTIELGQGPGKASTTGATIAPLPVKPAVEPAVGPSTGPATDVPAAAAAESPVPESVPAQAAVASRAIPASVESAPAAPAAPSGGWVVQVGAFGSADTARRLVGDLGGAGYRAFVSPVTKAGKTLHRVRVGPEPEKVGAEQLAQRLKARGLPATIVQND